MNRLVWEQTYTANVLRRGGWVHHEMTWWKRVRRFQSVAPGSILLQDIELGTRVTTAYVIQMGNLRRNGSPFNGA